MARTKNVKKAPSSSSPTSSFSEEHSSGLPLSDLSSSNRGSNSKSNSSGLPLSDLSTSNRGSVDASKRGSNSTSSRVSNSTSSRVSNFTSSRGSSGTSTRGTSQASSVTQPESDSESEEDSEAAEESSTANEETNDEEEATSTPQEAAPKRKKLRSEYNKPVSQSKRAGLIFPVSRVHKRLSNGLFAPHINKGASVYLAAVLEYVVAEVIEVAGNCTRAAVKKNITPRHIKLAVSNDVELDKLLEGVIIADGGVFPHIEAAILPRMSKSSQALSSKSSQRSVTSVASSSYSHEESEEEVVTPAPVLQKQPSKGKSKKAAKKMDHQRTDEE